MSEKGPSSDPLAFLTPGPKAQAEPYFAIMEIDKQGQTTGQIWTSQSRIMLFKFEADADRVVLALAQHQRSHRYALRGVTRQHLEALRGISRANKVPLFLISGFTQKGQIEAHPLGD